jgi:hypothetical protein
MCPRFTKKGRPRELGSGGLGKIFFLNISRRAAVFIALEGESIQTRSFRSPNRKNRKKKRRGSRPPKKKKRGTQPKR